MLKERRSAGISEYLCAYDQAVKAARRESLKNGGSQISSRDRRNYFIWGKPTEEISLLDFLKPISFVRYLAVSLRFKRF